MSKKKIISIEANAGTAAIRIVGDISNWHNSSEEFDANVNALISQGIQDATLYLNTYGGSTFEAFEIVNIIQRFPGTLSAELGAICASSGTIISSSCHRVKSARNTQFMIHRPWIDVAGNEDELQSAIKVLQNTQKSALDLYVKKSGQAAEELIAKWKTDWWMTAEEAKAEGFIDEIEGEAELDPEALSGLNMKKYKNLPHNIAAVLIEKKEIQIENHTMKKEVIAALLGMETNSDELAVQSAIEKQIEKAKKYDELIKAQANEKVEAAKKEIKTVVDTAITDKKITAAVRETYESIGEKSGIEALNAVFSGIGKVEKISSKLEGSDSGDAEMSYEDYQEKGKLRELRASDPEKFEKLFAQYREKINKQ